MSNEIERADAPVPSSPPQSAVKVPETYIDGYQGVFYKDGIVKLNMFSIALDSVSGKPYREPVLRMAMSVQTLNQVHSALGQLIADLERSGVVRRG